MVATSVTGAEGLQLGGLPPGLRFDLRAAHSDSASALVDAANDGHPSGPPVAGIQPWQKLPWSPINKPRGRWTRLQYADPELRDGPSIVHDPVRKRLILFGGFDGSDYHNDTWVFDEDGGTEWRPLHVDGPLPPGRSLHVAVYDSVADAMIAYGGSSAGPHFGDIWMLDLHGHSGWHELPQADEPRPARRGGCVGTLDIARHRLIISGGEADFRSLNDVWTYAFDTGHWTQIVPEARELARPHLALAYDSRRNRWLGFGGDAADVSNELWSWDLVRNVGWARLDYADQGPVADFSPNAVYDPVRDRLIVLGGAGYPQNQIDLSVIDLSRETRGRRLTLPGEQPPALMGAAAVYDPVRDRVLVFGGTTFDSQVLGDVWALSLRDSMRWTRLSGPGPGAPSPRAYASSIYDPQAQRWLVMFGWDGNKALNDIWSFDLVAGRWSLDVYGDYAGFQHGLYGAATAYDPIQNRVLIAGGSDGTNTYRDAWQFQMAPDPDRLLPLVSDFHHELPYYRYFASAFYDSSRDQMMLFAGICDRGSCIHDEWTMRTEADSALWNIWTMPADVPRPNKLGAGIYDPEQDRLVQVGGWEESQTYHPYMWSIGVSDSFPQWSHLGNGIWTYGASAVYDAPERRMLVFGGNLGAVRTNDVWQVSPVDGRVRLLQPGGTLPPERFLHGAAFDPTARRIFVYGGASYVSTNRDLLGDLWRLDATGDGSWRQLTESPLFPEQRSSHAALYDAPRDRMIVFGGSTFDGSVWVLPLGGPLRWSRLPTLGPSPGWRLGPGLVYDSRRDRAVVMSGSRGPNMALQDAWALSLPDPPAWSLIVPRNTPPEGGENSSCVYDSLRDRVVSFGGDAAIQRRKYDYYHFRHGAFALSLAETTWRSLTIVDGPHGNRTNQAAALEPSGDRILSFGGFDDQFGLTCDAWSIALDDSSFAYQPLDACAGPPASYAPTLVHDPAHSAFLLYGGEGGVWERPDDGSGSWTSIQLLTEPAPGRTEFSSVFDTNRERMLVWGGTSHYVNLIELWEFTWDPAPISQRPRAPRDPGPLIAARSPSPARGRIDVSLTLPDGAPARLELYDLAGRRIASRDLAQLGAGVHRMRLEESAGLSSGIYLIRLIRGGEVRTSRVVLLK